MGESTPGDVASFEHMQRPPGPPANVLVIDDEPLCAKTLSAMLIHLGAGKVDLAPDGDAALALVDEEEFDMIFCDLRMPGKDGVEVMRLLAERDVQSAIVLLSGSDSKLLRAARELGRGRGLRVLGALSKPIRLTELGALLKSASPSERPIHSRPPQASSNELEHGILNNELVLHYQPQLDLETLQLVGAEALVRWNHPTKGLLFPDTFIPVAESTELIEPLTDWVVATAISQSKQWHDEGLHLGVSVNLSAKTFRRLDLPDRLAAAVNRAELAPSEVTLEVTETGVTDDDKALLDIATRLRLKGFPLSIDDYGTGFANLTQLQRLPFTELKIDRSFVSGACKDAATSAVLKSSVELAKRLDLETVAEGIETEAEWRMLRELGVDRAQGYFMARPMAAEKIHEWLGQWRRKVA